MGDVLTRMSQIATLAQDPTISSSDVAGYQTGIPGAAGQLRHTIGGTTAEIGGTADVASPVGNFNDLTLYGSDSSGYQVVLGNSAAQSIAIPATNLRTGAMQNLISRIHPAPMPSTC